MHDRTSFDSYSLILVDLDGTLYSKWLVRIGFLIVMLFHFVTFRLKPRTALGILVFRKYYERLAAGELETENLSTLLETIARNLGLKSSSDVEQFVEDVTYWITIKPAHIIKLSANRILVDMLKSAAERGAVIGVVSDYPIGEKVSLLPLNFSFLVDGLSASRFALKPSPRIVEPISELVAKYKSKAVMIGDRYEKDGKLAENLNIKYLDISEIC